MHNQRNSTHLQAPARPPFPVAVPSAQGIRASSNSESGPPHPQSGLRYLPVHPGQFPAPQSRFPLERLTPSTEVLEHIHPGSTSRGDFHSDPTAHDAIHGYNSGPPNSFVAVPSRGLPGPFSYRLPQPIPLPDRRGSFGRNPPRGRKNPKKKSSDDARMPPSTGNGPRQGSNNTNRKQTFTSPHIQMPFNPRSPPFFQEVRPSVKNVPYSGTYHHPNSPPSHRSSNWPESVYHPPDHRNAPNQPKMEGQVNV